jgi:hypothetical protein
VVDLDRYELSLALVTETRHDPEDVDVSVPFCTEQPVAKPSMATKLNCPVPEPPEAVNVSGVPNTVLVLVKEIDACSSPKILNE